MCISLFILGIYVVFGAPFFRIPLFGGVSARAGGPAERPQPQQSDLICLIGLTCSEYAQCCVF